MKDTKRSTASQAKRFEAQRRRRTSSPLSTFSAGDRAKVEEDVRSLRKKGRERLLGKGD